MKKLYLWLSKYLGSLFLQILFGIYSGLLGSFFGSEARNIALPVAVNFIGLLALGYLINRRTKFDQGFKIRKNEDIPRKQRWKNSTDHDEPLKVTVYLGSLLIFLVCAAWNIVQANDLRNDRIDTKQELESAERNKKVLNEKIFELRTDSMKQANRVKQLEWQIKEINEKNSAAKRLKHGK